jgi:hypothetical protein
MPQYYSLFFCSPLQTHHSTRSTDTCQKRQRHEQNPFLCNMRRGRRHQPSSFGIDPKHRHTPQQLRPTGSAVRGGVWWRERLRVFARNGSQSVRATTTKDAPRYHPPTQNFVWPTAQTWEQRLHRQDLPRCVHSSSFHESPNQKST